MPALSSRYLETEFEEARVRSDYKRQRQILLSSNFNKDHRQSATSSSSNNQEQCGTSCCCCKASKLMSRCTLLLYSLFPALATVDFLLGLAARRLGWYERCLGEMVCAWSAAACAVWIALALSGLMVAAFAALGKCVAVAGSCCCCCRSRTAEVEQAV